MEKVNLVQFHCNKMQVFILMCDYYFMVIGSTGSTDTNTGTGNTVTGTTGPGTTDTGTGTTATSPK